MRCNQQRTLRLMLTCMADFGGAYFMHWRESPLLL